MTRRRNDREDVSLSFLDVIACAFGAIVLLVLILPVGEWGPFVAPGESAAQLGELLGRQDAVGDEIASRGDAIAANRALLQALTQDIADVEQEGGRLLAAIASTLAESERVSDQASTLAAATATATAGMRRAQTPRLATQHAGIPADADYVAIVIDTSGSMQLIWDQVLEQVAQVLDLYPQLKGFQILSDQGAYLMQPAGRWVDDSPARRRAARVRLNSWQTASDSNPVDGVRAAVDDLYRRDIRMALFVFGDDYAGNDFDPFLEAIDRIVSRRQVREGSLRIHGVAFMNLNQMLGIQVAASPLNLSILLRALSSRYDGAFLALPPEPVSAARQMKIVRAFGGQVAAPRF